MFYLYLGLYGYFCGICLFFQNVSRLDESCGKHTAMICCCPLCAIGGLKTDVRKKYNIEVGPNIFLATAHGSMRLIFIISFKVSWLTNLNYIYYISREMVAMTVAWGCFVQPAPTVKSPEKSNREIESREPKI